MRAMDITGTNVWHLNQHQLMVMASWPFTAQIEHVYSRLGQAKYMATGWITLVIS